MLDISATALTGDPRSRERIAEAICTLLPQMLGREIEGASADTALLDAVGLTSTTGLELLLRLEESMELEISVEELDRDDFETIGSLASYVAANLLTEE
ncbi:phosphopantetheine-binding protein [Actinocrinis puniceicyclus]|uniref:Phosphopantetheine-binding protein n=1 Tax=Actinocrinis puniceicyclus TaxID=977794 RepID=A0A8J7WQB3_9ACTN|nr:phosphopantetheine-binding protein [Actinocrinis puniceicyclus]MBS2964407.1 phosphopantetheine-binding protein [Actinocrinis puniceicyclus]